MASERKIGNRVFRCEKLPAADALPLFAEFTALVDPYSMQVVRDGGNRASAAEAFLALFAGSADSQKLIAFFSKAAELCTVGPDPVVVGMHAATLEDLAEVAFFALEVQFRDFLRVSLGTQPTDQGGNQGSAPQS